MGGYHAGKHHLVKMILKLIIVMLIFWFGFSLGQMTGFIKAEGGRGMMMRGGNVGWGMMQGNNFGALPVQTPATPAK